MMTISKKKNLISFLALFISINSHSSETVSENKAKDIFVNANPIKRSPPKYPPQELKSGNVGMVDIFFMIDKEGATYEPVIETSSKPSFETPALSALKNYKYKPATLNGEPIESSQSVRIVFLVQNQDDKVSQHFNKHYKSAVNELNKDKPNQDKVKRKIKSMENSDHLSSYSYRHLNTVKYSYAEKFDSKQSQINAIYQLLLFESRTKTDKGALKKDQRISARRSLVSLLIQTSRFGDAIREYRTLNKIDPEAESIFKDALQQINQIRTDDSLIKTQLYLNENGYNLGYLFKNTFGFLEGSENVTQLKLRCDKKFKILDYKPESEYKIPKSWGKCSLQTIGVPGSNVALYQI